MACYQYGPMLVHYGWAFSFYHTAIRIHLPSPCGLIAEPWSLSDSPSISCFHHSLSIIITGGNLCQFDSVTVFQNSSFGNSSLGKFCGDVAPQSLSSRGKMTVRFTTDADTTDRGWRAFFVKSGQLQQALGLGGFLNGMTKWPSETPLLHRLKVLEKIKLSTLDTFACCFLTEFNIVPEMLTTCLLDSQCHDSVGKNCVA